METRTRNRGCFPNLSTEGVILKPPCKEIKKCVGWDWHRGLTVYQRLNCSHTLASVRRSAYFKPFKGLIPIDALDISLASVYDHGRDVLPEKVDCVLQAETMNLESWRRLRNTGDVKVLKDAISLAVAESLKEAAGVGATGVGVTGFGATGVDATGIGATGVGATRRYVRYNEFHPVHIGGVTERRHPSNIKLMNSSHHSSLTNAGFSRQDKDGNAFVY